jgi:putative ABC transport system permease protein
MMVWEASRWIAAGAVAGILASVLVAHWIGTLLFGIQANDPTTLTAAAAVLVLVAVIAAWIPARRTMRVDPLVALRYE